VNISERSRLSFGVQGGFKQVGFSLEELNFGSQYDPTYKGGFDPNKRPDYLNLNNRNGFDASAGACWQVYLNPTLAMKTGVAAFHLIPVKTDFLNEDTYLKPKYVFSANARYKGYYLHWIPSAMYVAQSNYSYAEIGLISQFRDMDKFSNVGIYYRNPNVIIPTIGIGLDRLSINLSLEYYLRSSYSQILNIGILYFPQTGKKPNLGSGFMDV
jgi:hypothetical protein